MQDLTITSYPEKTTGMAGEIPSDFTVNISINKTSYFRALAIIDGTNYWSDEKRITIYTAPTIKMFSIPKRVVENTDFTITWEVSGGAAGNIDRTEIIWDFKKGNASITDYSHNTSSMTGKTPLELTGILKIPQTSTIYFRAYAIVDGMEIFSDEFPITIFPEYTTY
ncbi:MAG TPA: hypothetical protein VER35_00665 [Candidatus Limnocylindrales bacterium]|nr:hypothetical protein [Candidatus Limnocylindrales bacterium]